MVIYMKKIKRMEKKLEDWQRKEVKLRVEGERIKERMRELDKKLEKKEVDEKK